MQPVLMWFAGWGLCLVVGAISGAFVVFLAGLLHDRLGWHQEMCIALFGLVGVAGLVSIDQFGLPLWLGIVAVLLCGWMAFVYAAVPLVILWHAGKWVIGRVRGRVYTSRDGAAGLHD